MDYSVTISHPLWHCIIFNNENAIHATKIRGKIQLFEQSVLLNKTVSPFYCFYGGITTFLPLFNIIYLCELEVFPVYAIDLTICTSYFRKTIR